MTYKGVECHDYPGMAHTTRRRGALSKNGQSLTAYISGQPQYLLILAPAAGQFACKVVQSNNGKRLDGGASFPSTDAAFQGGLDDLRKALGW